MERCTEPDVLLGLEVQNLWARGIPSCTVSTWHCTTESCIKQGALAELKAVQAGTGSPFSTTSHHASVPQVLINETQWRRRAALQHRREDSIYVTDAGCWVPFSKATIPKAVRIKIRGEKNDRLPLSLQNPPSLQRASLRTH